jgi:dihydrolipoamide dehydrogenase
MAEIAAKVLVVGGGPGGYVCAIRAGQLGLDVVLVEQGGLDGGLGGTCLNVGCIPSKALIHAADAYERAAEQAKSAPFGLRVERPTIDFARTIEWKNGIVGRLTSGVGALLKRHRVKILQGRAVMVDGKTCRVETDTGPQVVSAEHVVLATGSVPVALPALPFGGRIISSTEALSLPAIPERLAVVGAGYIGLELGTAFAKLGAKVTVIEAENRILPTYDDELVRPVVRRLRALGVEVLTRSRAVGLADAGAALRIGQEGAPTRTSRPTGSSSPRKRARTQLRLETIRPHDEWPLRSNRRAARPGCNRLGGGVSPASPCWPTAPWPRRGGRGLTPAIARRLRWRGDSGRVFHRSGDRHRRALAR